jgi:DNA repair protein RadC
MRAGRLAQQEPLRALQERFIRLGFEGLNDQEVIELLLSLVLPAQKCKRLARKGVKRFGNVRGLLSASREELQQTGFPLYSIFYIKLLHDLPIEVLRQQIVDKPLYKSSREIFDYLYYSMRDLKNEIFKVIYLNNRGQIIDTTDLFEGALDSIPIQHRDILESAIKNRATALIFVHNHPTGDPSPSRSDKRLTRDLVFMGDIMQIKVLDHIIVGNDVYFSFADKGLIQRYQDDFLNLRLRRV